jgi:hypothetical protein
VFELSGETRTHAAYRYMHTTFHAINDLKLLTCFIHHLETSLNQIRALRLLQP